MAGRDGGAGIRDLLRQRRPHRGNGEPHRPHGRLRLGRGRAGRQPGSRRTRSASAGWGAVQPAASGTYTFFTESDDGVRLWVNGQQVVNNWTDHARTENSGTISLTGGVRYAIRMEFYERGGDAVARLLWSGPSTAKTVIQQSALDPRFGARINFQPAGAAVPAGYLPDARAVLGLRSGGERFGWNADNTAQTRDRNATNSPDQRYDTLTHLQKPANPNAVWEIVVPNGTYTVRVVAGDAAHFDGVFRLNVEGVLALSGTPSASTRWFDVTSSVTVSDGRLTISKRVRSSEQQDLLRRDLVITGVPPASRVRSRSGTAGVRTRRRGLSRRPPSKNGAAIARVGAKKATTAAPSSPCTSRAWRVLWHVGGFGVRIRARLRRRARSGANAVAWSAPIPDEPWRGGAGDRDREAAAPDGRAEHRLAGGAGSSSGHDVPLPLEPDERSHGRSRDGPARTVDGRHDDTQRALPRQEGDRADTERSRDDGHRCGARERSGGARDRSGAEKPTRHERRRARGGRLDRPEGGRPHTPRHGRGGGVPEGVSRGRDQPSSCACANLGRAWSDGDRGGRSGDDGDDLRPGRDAFGRRGERVAPRLRVPVVEGDARPRRDGESERARPRALGARRERTRRGARAKRHRPRVPGRHREPGSGREGDAHRRRRCPR
ncbi:MAG: hypothetical protein H0U30_02660 [Actinobacteria bacterium]|nr:hypothetical protein [Actinomycetota bacterium]